MEDNREKLLDCALELFADKGYEGVGVQEIVNAAGVTKPTLYHYFGSKEGLLRELLSSRYIGILAQLKKAAEYSSDVPLTLYRLTKTFFNIAVENTTLITFMYSLTFYPKHSIAYEAARPLVEELNSYIHEFFLKAAQNHGNMKGREKMYTISFIGTVCSYITSYIADSESVKLDEELIYRINHQFMYGIFS